MKGAVRRDGGSARSTTGHSPAQAQLARIEIFGATWLAYVGFYFCRKPFSVAKGTIGSELQLDASHLGTIGAAYLIAYAAGQFLAGTLGSRLGPRRLLLAGMALAIAATAGFASGSGLSVWMLLNGLGQAVGWPAGVALMAAWFSHAERGRVMGLWATNFQVGSLVATFVVAAVLVRWGWQATFYTGAAVLAAVWLFNLTVLRERPEDVGLPVPCDTAAAGGPVAAAHWTRGLMIDVALIGTFYFFIKFIRYALWSWVPYFLQHNYGLRSDDAGYFSTLFDIAGIPGVVVTGWISDHFFRGRRAAASLLMMLLLFASCGLLLAFGGTSLTIFAVCLVLVGFTLYGPDALMTGAAAMDLGDRRMTLRVTGVIAACGACGPIVQELVIGRLYDSHSGDLRIIFALLFGSAALSALALTARVQRERRSHAQRG
ncbi:MAG TPA: MFS transporter [Terriglobales bacterium]|nr:MFS transporter [Terriglobales bacterium]